MNASTSAPIKEMRVEAVVIRADGTREDLGVVSHYRMSLVKRLLLRLALFLSKD